MAVRGFAVWGGLDEPRSDDMPPIAVDKLSAINRLLTDEARRLGATAVLRGGSMELGTEAAPAVRVPLRALLVQCQRTAPDQWPALVADYLARHLRGIDLTPYVDAETALPLLRTLLQPAAAPDAIAKPITDGLCEVAVLDLADVMCVVTTELAERWCLQPLDLLARGRAQAREQLGRCRVTHFGLPSSGQTAVGLEARPPSPFISLTTLWLNEIIDVPSEAGAVVIVPSPEVLFAHVIQSRHSLYACADLKDAAQRLAAVSAYPISPSLFWWHEGCVTALRLVLDRGGNPWYEPAAFLATLQRLWPLAR